MQRTCLTLLLAVTLVGEDARKMPWGLRVPSLRLGGSERRASRWRGDSADEVDLRHAKLPDAQQGVAAAVDSDRDAPHRRLQSNSAELAAASSPFR